MRRRLGLSRVGLAAIVALSTSLALVGIQASEVHAAVSLGGVTASPTDSGADLTWRGSLPDSVAAYLIVVRDQHSGHTFSVSTHGNYRAAHLSDLTDGVRYSVTVIAEPAALLVGATSVTPRAAAGHLPHIGKRLSISSTHMADGTPSARIQMAPFRAGPKVDYVELTAVSAAGTPAARIVVGAARHRVTQTLGPLAPNAMYSIAAAAHSADGFGPLAWTTIRTGASSCPVGACLSLRRDSHPFTPRVNGLLYGVGDGPAAAATLGSMRPAFVRENVGYGVSAASGELVRRTRVPLIENLSDAWYNKTDSGLAGGAMPPWECWTCYAQFVRAQVLSIESGGLHPEYWEIQNEPGGAGGYFPDHLNGDAGLFLKQLETAATAIRAVDPSARILGPTNGWFSLGSTRADQPNVTLDAVLAHATQIPGFAGLDWHEIDTSDTAGLAGDDVAIAKQLATAAGYPDLPMVVSEYTTPYDAPLAGAAATWIGRLSDAGVTAASRSCWGNQPGEGSTESTCVGMADGLLTTAGRLTGPGQVARFYGSLGDGNATRVAVANTSLDVSATASTDASGVTRILVGHEASCLPGVNPACPSYATASPGTSRIRIVLPTSARRVIERVRTFAARPGPSRSRSVRRILSTKAGRVVINCRLADGAAAAITLTPRGVQRPRAGR